MPTLKTKTNSGWQAISAIVEKAYVQANEPSNPMDGDIWIDTDETPTTFLPDGTLSNSFSLTLPSNNWSNNQQTITDSRFKTNGFSYIITPSSNSVLKYGEAQIYANDINVDNNITFVCQDTPNEDLIINITRIIQ